MTTLTIRIEDELKLKAMSQADKLGVPLTLIIKTALRNFIASPKVIIGDVEPVEVTPDIQAQMDTIGDLLSKI